MNQVGGQQQQRIPPGGVRRRGQVREMAARSAARAAGRVQIPDMG